VSASDFFPYVAAADIRLDATATAACARRRVVVPPNFHVADFAGAVGRAFDELAVDDHASADAGADVHGQHVLAAFRRAGNCFAPRDRVDVVVDADGEAIAQALRELLAERDVAPLEVR